MPRGPCWANALPRAMVTAANATPVQSLRLFCKVMAFSLPQSRRYPDGMPPAALSTALPVRKAFRGLHRSLNRFLIRIHLSDQDVGCGTAEDDVHESVQNASTVSKSVFAGLAGLAIFLSILRKSARKI